MSWARGIPPRAMIAELAKPLGHLQCRLGGLFAAVPHVPARARPRLLLGQRGDEAERRGDARRERDVPDAGRGLTRDVLEVRRLPADDDADAHDP
jgi:hypothetical protein